MKYELVSIDFWNTLFDSSNGTERNRYRHRVLIEEIDKFGLVIKADRLHEATAASWKNFEKYWQEHHRTPPCRETVEFMFKFLDLPLREESIDKIVEEFENSLFVHPPKLIEGVKDVLPKLAENYKLGLISDTGFSPGTHLRKLMDKNGILEYFSSFSFSNETGVSKPHEKAYHTVIEELKSEPSKGIHIGDIERTDVEGARKVGMKSLLFTGVDAEYFRGDPNTSKADYKAKHWNEIGELLGAG